MRAAVSAASRPADWSSRDAPAISRGASSQALLARIFCSRWVIWRRSVIKPVVSLEMRAISSSFAFLSSVTASAIDVGYEAFHVHVVQTPHQVFGAGDDAVDGAARRRDIHMVGFPVEGQRRIGLRIGIVELEVTETRYALRYLAHAQAFLDLAPDHADQVVLA